MSRSKIQRFAFVRFDALKEVKFKKLSRVASKIFVFIHKEKSKIPFDLVQQFQKLGKSLKWVRVEVSSPSAIQMYMAFITGQMHQKVDRKIEFAILSNDDKMDHIIADLNESGRSVVRVKYGKKKEAKSPPQVETIKSAAFALKENGNNGQFNDDMPIILEDDLVIETARKTINKLQESGNRPSEVSTLKSYILLHNDHDLVNNSLDDVIQQMAELNEIEIVEGEVTYNF